MVETEGFDYVSSGVSRDGSRIYAHAGSSLDAFLIYDALAGTTSHVFTNLAAPYAISVDRDGSRVILNDANVYDRAFRSTGNVPSQGPFATLISHDGSRAFVCQSYYIQPRVDVYDLNGPLQPGAMYPLIESIPLPDPPSDPDAYAMAMTSTPDDTVLFIAGANRLLVVPVP
jgi:DNA-binding beta-propeller fold protein YncE